MPKASGSILFITRGVASWGLSTNLAKPWQFRRSPALGETDEPLDASGAPRAHCAFAGSEKTHGGHPRCHLAEIGDKTQLLAFLLASRFKKPTPIILGILVATIFNHSLASALGAWITHVFSPEVIKWIIVGSFLAMAAWILIPDKGDDDALKNHSMRFGVFGVTFITFFLAEMGDKTQIATVALTVKYATPVLVVIGTTIGMLIADVPAVWIGDKLAQKIPVKLARIASAVLFAAIGILAAFEYAPTEL